MSAWQVYLLLKMDDFRAFLIFTYLAIITIAVIYIIHLSMIYKDENYISTKIKKLMKKLAIAFTIVLTLEVILPSTRTLALMYIVPKITQNKELKKIPPLLLKYVEHELKQKASEQ